MIAIVPARGDSVGLPGKNIKVLHGKPMIAYTIEAALKSKYIDEVVISTDCAEIETIAIGLGAKSHFLRPAELASNSANAVDNYIYTIDRMNNEFDYNIEEFVVLQPTSPLRISKDIDDAIELYRNKKAESVISCTKEFHPVTWHKYISEDGRLEDVLDVSLANRQDFKTTYFPNGAIFVFNYDLIQQKKYYSQKTYAYIMPSERSVDVDDESDFKYAEYLLKERNG
ncbi:MAG: N-acylneuraminate cytidylyltransferase [Planctomycetota bacterium]|nr:MAG: N-acylneuraminate cytidylyltransferase [Planctomycetota bacterium]